MRCGLGMMTARTTKEVFEDHLQLALTNEWHKDLERNFSKHCVLLTGFGVFQGLEGVMDAANLLMKQLPNAKYIYRTRLWQSGNGLLGVGSCCRRSSCRRRG